MYYLHGGPDGLCSTKWRIFTLADTQETLILPKKVFAYIYSLCIYSSTTNKYENKSVSFHLESYNLDIRLSMPDSIQTHNTIPIYQESGFNHNDQRKRWNAFLYLDKKS